MSPGRVVPVRVLAVCTANISRSPAVERLLRRGLDDSVHVASAGVMALVGEPIDPPVARFLADRGADNTGFAARQVTLAQINEADLVLTLTREHRAHVLGIAPAAVRRTFTLLEFSRVLGSANLIGLDPAEHPGERLRRLVPLATAQRALAPRPATAGDDDVPDPFGHGPEAYAHALGLISRATNHLRGLLTA